MYGALRTYRVKLQSASGRTLSALTVARNDEQACRRATTYQNEKDPGALWRAIRAEYA